MPLSKRTFLINPLNNTADGFSHKNGNPVVKFSIPQQDLFLESATLRLSGQVQIKSQTGALIAPDGKGDGTADAFSTMNVDNPALPQSSQCAVNFGNFGGVHNCIDKIVITSKKSKVELTSSRGGEVNTFGVLENGISVIAQKVLQHFFTGSPGEAEFENLIKNKIYWNGEVF